MKKKRKVKTHCFNGRRYKIFLEDSKQDGYVDAYKIEPDDRHLVICADKKTKDELITTIHEALHAENWAATEEVVERVSMEIGTFLWRLGYRRKG